MQLSSTATLVSRAEKLHKTLSSATKLLIQLVHGLAVMVGALQLLHLSALVSHPLKDTKGTLNLKCLKLKEGFFGTLAPEQAYSFKISEAVLIYTT